MAQILTVGKAFDGLLYGIAKDGQELSVKNVLLQIRDVAGLKCDLQIVRAMLVAYRRDRLLNQDEEFFEIPL